MKKVKTVRMEMTDANYETVIPNDSQLISVQVKKDEAWCTYLVEFNEDPKTGSLK
jgi:hypothetical protein